MTSDGQCSTAALRRGLPARPEQGGGAVLRRGQTLAADKQDPPLSRDRRPRLGLFTEPQGAPAQIAKHFGVVSVPQDLGAQAGGHDVVAVILLISGVCAAMTVRRLLIPLTLR